MQIEHIHTLSDPRLEAYVGLTDAQLRNRIEPEKGIFITESEKVIARALAAGYEPISFLMEEKWLAGLRDAIEVAESRLVMLDRSGEGVSGQGVSGQGASGQGAAETSASLHPCGAPVFIADRALLAELTGYEVTRGALAAFRRHVLPSVAHVCRDAKRIAVLEDVTNTVNIGSVFRNAAALGVDAVLLTPGCCDPLYRRALRVSMGNVLNVPWTYIGREVEGKGVHGNVQRAGGWCETGIGQLRDLGFKLAALALKDDACSLDDVRLKECERLAIVLGTEGDGLSDRTIRECDFAACIPMAHGVDSLNVAAASAVAFWELRVR